MNLKRCKFVTKLPSLLCAPNLKGLYMSDCKNLIEVDESFGHLHKLETWKLRRCIKLEILPSHLKLTSLIHFDLASCERLEKFPAICAPDLEILNIALCKNLEKVDESVGDLDKLLYWDLQGCIKLKILPSRLQLRSLPVAGFERFLIFAQRAEEAEETTVRLERLKRVLLGPKAKKKLSPTKMAHS